MRLFECLRDYPYLLEVNYKFAETVFARLHPLIRKLGYERADKLMRVPEKLGKGAVFNCQQEDGAVEIIEEIMSLRAAKQRSNLSA